jgi:hypothetical protein
MIVAAHRAPIDLKKRLRHQGRAYRLLLRLCSDLRAHSQPSVDVNAAKSADMSERSEA